MLSVSQVCTSHVVEMVINRLLCGKGGARKAQNSPASGTVPHIQGGKTQIPGEKSPKRVPPPFKLASEPLPTAIKLN